LIELRPLLSFDAPFLWEMLYHAIFVPEGEPKLPLTIIQEPGLYHYVQNWGRPDDLGYCAISRLQPVGAVWSRLFDPSTPGYGYVNAHIPELSIALLPAFRGRGIGTQLMKIMLQRLAGRYTAVSLSVSVDNPALRLYQQFGFQEISCHDKTLVMCKRL
jgi:ribosomal protein S18 acetylase RimI-like enzyme